MERQPRARQIPEQGAALLKFRDAGGTPFSLAVAPLGSVGLEFAHEAEQVGRHLPQPLELVVGYFVHGELRCGLRRVRDSGQSGSGMVPMHQEGCGPGP